MWGRPLIRKLVLPRRHQLRRNWLIGHGLEKWKPVLLTICYSDLIFGNMFCVECRAMWTVIDAYSVIVTKALAGPSAMSGSDIGLATSDALRAIASPIRRSRENPARAASPISDRAVVKTRRVMNNSPLRNSTPVCSENLIRVDDVPDSPKLAE